MPLTESTKYVSLGALVTTNPDVADAQAISGDRIPRERLGAGIVEEVGEDGWLLVHWTGAEVRAWMASEDLSALGADVRLVTISRCTNKGDVRSTRQMAVGTAGLKHHWTVQVRPGCILRTIRDDGLIWTFDWNPIFRRANFKGASGLVPPDDDDAEALTVAEIAMR